MRLVDLFCGCGGLSKGFQNASYQIIAAFDNWESAIKVYQANFPNHPIINCDLAKIDSYIQNIRDYNAEIIVGGPPCQDFSSAGKRDETLGRANLTNTFATIINLIKPQWFIMENVERITASEVFKNAYTIFKNSGYGLTQQVIDASLCGVPQARKRLFLIGELNGVDNALKPVIDEQLALAPMTVRDYLGSSLGIEHYYRHPRSYARRGIFSINEPSPTIRGVNRPIPSNYKLHPGDLVSSLENIRPLTTKERSLIQTFPADFIFEGTKADLEQMIGNAVPVKLAEFVASCIKTYNTSKERPVSQNFFREKTYSIGI